MVEYVCIGDVGVAWRNSKNVKDRFELVAGPSTGDIVWPLGPAEDDWLAVDVPASAPSIFRFGTKVW